MHLIVLCKIVAIQIGSNGDLDSNNNNNNKKNKETKKIKQDEEDKEDDDEKEKDISLDGSNTLASSPASQ